MFRPIAILATLLTSLVMFAGCEQQGPAERAGERIDDAIENTGDRIEESCEEMRARTGADIDC